MDFVKELIFLKKFDDGFIKEFQTKVQIYKKIFYEFNKIHNLSNFKNIDNEIKDSLKVLDFHDFSGAKNVVDVGSGAGFPAFFLACVLNANFHLFEPNAKKAAFLRSVKIECGLKNLQIYKEKIENYKSPFTADIITSRALMETKKLLELCSLFSDEKTLFILYKGSKVDDELKGLNSKIYEQGFRKYCILSLKY